MENLLEKYEDQFTLDGTLYPQAGVTRESAKRARELFLAARSGRNYEAQGRFKELFTSTSLPFSVAHILNIDMIPQLPEQLLEIEGLVGQPRVVETFDPVVLRSLIGRDGVDGAGVDQYGAAASVLEGTPYPIVTVESAEESFHQRLRKAGFRFNVTLEALINDRLVGQLEGLPDEFLKTTQKTIYADIFESLNAVSTYLESVTLPDGTTTTPNAPVSAMAIIGAVVALENRTINGNKIGTIDDVNVIVPKGTRRFLEYDIAKFGRVIEVQDGALTLGPDREIQSLFPNVKIFESDRVTGTNWFLYPKPGTTPRPVLERLSLRGYEQPEIRVHNDGGTVIAGGNRDGFITGFDADTLSYRYRFITGSALWDQVWVIRSNGTGVA